MQLTQQQINKFWELVNAADGHYETAMQSIVDSTIGVAVDEIWKDKGLAWEDKRYLKKLLEGIE